MHRDVANYAYGASPSLSLACSLYSLLPYCTDLAAVDRKLDSFAAQYQNQLSDQEASMARLTKYASQLADGAHPEAEESQQSALALQTKLKQIKKDAQVYSEVLDAARAREAQLASALKAFHEKRSRVMEWSDSSHQLVALSDNETPVGLERGCGLATVENKVDAFQAEYQLRQPLMQTLVDEMKQLSNELTEGQHAEADAVVEQQTARKADIEELGVCAIAYEEKLNGVLRREMDLVAAQKQFKAGASKLENWLGNTLALTAIPQEVSDQPFGPGNNIEAIELLVSIQKKNIALSYPS
jgi:hypothetical protein